MLGDGTSILTSLYLDAVFQLKPFMGRVCYFMSKGAARDRSV